MHYHDDLGSKMCLYVSPFKWASLSSSALLRYGLWKLVKKTGLILGIEADITGQGTNLSPILIGRDKSVAVTSCGWSYLKDDTYMHILNLNHHHGAFAL